MEKIKEAVIMDYREVTVWTIIKRFIAGWGIALSVIAVISCVKYKDFILTVFTNSIWAWINAIMPVAIVIFGLFYIVKSQFGKGN